MLESWRPLCSTEQLRARAKLYQAIRLFFSKRGVLEVETPLLSHGIGTDPQLDFFTTAYYSAPRRQTLFLQTSPEFAMKRLVAASSGSIFQICKAFRNGESGRFHNPEFTLLEWYRVGFTLSELMDEIADLIVFLFQDQPISGNPIQRYRYQDIFACHTGLNALEFSYQDYCACARAQQLPDAPRLCGHEHRLWLDLLFSQLVQPHLGNNALCLVFGYPACQSSLARKNQYDSRITDRVEVFINGVELGNGYYELTDVHEQQQRFEQEIMLRQENQQTAPVLDQRFLSALASGLPDCAGMAIGLDRLLMLLTNSKHINDVLAFPIANA